MATRQTDWINNSWRAPAVDPLTKELIYLAVSATNQCGYCRDVCGIDGGGRDANETNPLASGYQVEIDERFQVRSSSRSPVADSVL